MSSITRLKQIINESNKGRSNAIKCYKYLNQYEQSRITAAKYINESLLQLAEKNLTQEDKVNITGAIRDFQKESLS